MFISICMVLRKIINVCLKRPENIQSRLRPWISGILIFCTVFLIRFLVGEDPMAYKISVCLLAICLLICCFSFTASAAEFDGAYFNVLDYVADSYSLVSSSTLILDYSFTSSLPVSYFNLLVSSVDTPINSLSVSIPGSSGGDLSLSKVLISSETEGSSVVYYYRFTGKLPPGSTLPQGEAGLLLKFSGSFTDPSVVNVFSWHGYDHLLLYNNEPTLMSLHYGGYSYTDSSFGSYLVGFSCPTMSGYTDVYNFNYVTKFVPDSWRKYDYLTMAYQLTVNNIDSIACFVNGDPVSVHYEMCPGSILLRNRTFLVTIEIDLRDINTIDKNLEIVFSGTAYGSEYAAFRLYDQNFSLLIDPADPLTVWLDRVTTFLQDLNITGTEDSETLNNIYGLIDFYLADISDYLYHTNTEFEPELLWRLTDFDSYLDSISFDTSQNNLLLQSIDSRLKLIYDNILLLVQGSNAGSNQFDDFHEDKLDAQDRYDSANNSINEGFENFGKLEGLDTNSNAILNASGLNVLAVPLRNIVSHPIILMVLTIVLTCAIIGFVLFGKR